METLSTVMPIILYTLTSILVLILIVLSIKIIYTIDKINAIVDDVNKKVKSLNGFFNVIDMITDKVALLSDRTVDFISNLFTKVLSSRKKNNNKGEENNE